jgi:hypothetical protein
MIISTITFGEQPPVQEPGELMYIKHKARPEFQIFDMKNDKGNYGTRRRTRPWDNCWFSNKPQLINITVEEACNLYPSYMKWIYNNLNIKWSVYSIQIFEKL